MSDFGLKGRSIRPMPAFGKKALTAFGDRRVGLLVRKSRWRLGSCDNRGGFMLIKSAAA
jgi:hypothetical protein